MIIAHGLIAFQAVGSGFAVGSLHYSPRRGLLMDGSQIRGTSGFRSTCRSEAPCGRGTVATLPCLKAPWPAANSGLHLGVDRKRRSHMLSPRS